METRWAVLGGAAAVACAIAVTASMPTGAFLKRLIPVNIFVLGLFVFVPWSTEGTPLWRAGGFAYTAEGLELAATVGLRANAIVMTAGALLGALDPLTLSSAMRRLGAPPKLCLLFVLSTRYIGLFRQEYLRLFRAARVRCFEPGANWRTLQTQGHLVGALLLRSMDRADRVLAAMRCRGFHGELPAPPGRPWSIHDAAFAAGATIVFAGVLWTP